MDDAELDIKLCQVQVIWQIHAYLLMSEAYPLYLPSSPLSMRQILIILFVLQYSKVSCITVTVGFETKISHAFKK